MPKRYSYRRYYGSRDKYSVEESAGNIVADTDGNGAVTVVPISSVQGMRKVKHITISLACKGQAAYSVVYWALIYVPEGMTPNALNITPNNSMYEPNQYVMNCGVVDFDAGPVRFTSPLARNLNSGDQIALLIKVPGAPANAEYFYCVRYAITLQ